MNHEAIDFTAKFLVALIMSPSYGVALPDINSQASATTRKRIAVHLAESGLITNVGKTKGKRWIMDDKMRNIVSQFVSRRPEVLVELASRAEPDHQIRRASDKVRSIASGATPLFVGGATT
jgi:hypothetical protein